MKIAYDIGEGEKGHWEENGYKEEEVEGKGKRTGKSRN